MRCFWIAALFLALAWMPTAPEAQQREPARIGWLTIAPHPMIEPFRQGLRDLGYIEGQSVEIVYRYADGRNERLPELAADLARQGVDIIVASGSTAMLAAHRTIKTAPVVFVAADPVGQGVVPSLARPGGNMTGLALTYDETSVKWLELANEILPSAMRLAVLTDSAGNPGQFRTLEAAAGPLRKELLRFVITERREYEHAFAMAREREAGAMIVVSSPLFAAHKRMIVDAAARHTLPTVYEHRDFVEAGGLISYGPDLREVFRRAAFHVDRILKGAKPADLPVEQPSKFELVINLKTAQALGLAIPPALLARADEVIE